MVADDHDSWDPEKLRLRPLRSIVGWIIAAISVYVAAGLVPGVAVDGTLSAFLTAAVIAIFNAIAPPMIAALRLPFTLLLGFLLVLIVDALALRVAADVFPDHVSVAAFRDALLAALVIAAVSMVLQAIVGTGDDDTYTLRVVRRIARRQHAGRHGHRRHRLPRDRRARAARPAPGHARRQRSDDGALGGGRRLRARRVGAGPVIPDRCEPGRDPARIQ